ncbi:MAG: UDP-N-acetylmuramoyl-L-alanyl-D-glutamate--2,6-diaminopimelate ligase [Polyangiaceae bacterium]
MTEEDRPSSPPVTTPPPKARLVDVVREIPGATLAGEPGAERVAVTGLHHDSRAVEGGDVFVAREGGKVSGLDYVRTAVERGAVAVIARRGALSPARAGVPVVEVDDVPLALALASACVYGHPTFGLEVVGITGTNGKTTTTLLTRALLEAAGSRPGIVGTLGSEFDGVRRASPHTSPEADELARIARDMRDRGATHLVMEVSSIALAAKRADGVRFRVAAFTNLTQDHLDYHGDMRTYAEAKARLFTELTPGASVINVRDPFGRELASRLDVGASVVRYSSATDVGDPVVYPLALEASSAGVALSVASPAGRIEIVSPLVGAHNVENLLAAVAIGCALGLEPAQIGDGLSRDVRVPGRLERCDDPATDDVTVLVDYAHTPDALARVLASVRAFAKGRVLCVFGCGGDRDPTKRPKMGEAAGRGADLSILTNDNPRSEAPQAIADAVVPGLASAGTPFEVELDRRAAIRRAVELAQPGDIVLVAGKGHETYQIIGAVTHAFDDRVEARAALALRRAERGGRA